jgi:hypothetical protein
MRFMAESLKPCGWPFPRRQCSLCDGHSSQGRVYQLTQALRTASKERWKRLRQFLSEAGVKALRTELGQTLGIAQVSQSAEQYEAHIKRIFGGQPDLFRK